MLQLFSPAKINLFLRILSKRPDGYHNLSSLFQAIDLGDNISFELHSHDLLTCSDPRLPVDNRNLILKAIELFRRKTGHPIYLKVDLEKIIPVQAGLGGGSSNAATTLWALNKLSGLKIKEFQLIEWGAEIGSDVPFFLSRGTAYCTGRGEMIREIDAPTSSSVWIVKPTINQSTLAVYQQLRAPLKAIENEDLKLILEKKIAFFNDLESPAFEIHPELYRLKLLLLASGFETVLLSGSGSAFFCLGEGKIPSDANLQVFQTKFINREKDSWFKSNYTICY